MGVAVDVTGRHRKTAFVGEGCTGAVRVAFINAQADYFAGCICGRAYCFATAVKFVNDIQFFPLSHL